MLALRGFRILLKVASLILLLAGTTGLGGSFFLHKYRVYGVFFSSLYIILPAILAVAGGVILLISGCTGCSVSNKKPSCGHGLFVYFLIIVWCIVGTTAVLAYTHKGKLDADLAPLKDVFQNYSGNSQDPDTKAVNALQCELRCCGVKNYTDWLETPWFNHSGKYEVPLSCCNKNFHSCNGTLDSPQLLYNEGCQVKLEKKLLLSLHVIIITSLVVLFLLVMSWIIVAQLMRHQPPQEYRILDQE
ncbi:tetraspanin 37 [Sinocyclocheilus grahami]|uniref:tetraspanin 37 n=1 Tax=Sinocyclocheilus grahami TaxID=75366 RepID=UPI0007AC839B|nr:PREDICTED: tetraspanin-3-like [Sinocyclocheilus grahami]